MWNIYPTDWMKREFGLKQDNDVKQAQLMYWKRLRNARTEYAVEAGVDALERVSIDNNEGFYYWLQRKYGIKLEFIDGNISGAYQITDQKKYTFFLLKHPG